MSELQFIEKEAKDFKAKHDEIVKKLNDEKLDLQMQNDKLSKQLSEV